MCAKKLPFCGYLTASGQGEVWDHTDAKKFDQFGWRCKSNETAYSHETLIGNWNEERYDVNTMNRMNPVISQYDHYFDTTYGLTYNKDQDKNKGRRIQVTSSTNGLRREPQAFPRHQPELDTGLCKAKYNSFETTSMAAYKNCYKQIEESCRQQENQIND